MTITRFRDQYDFLSNFYICTIMLDSVDYPSVEHAFQAAKTFDSDERYQVQTAPTPAQAKRLGRRVTLREDWESVKLDILEVNTWNDRFYGAMWNEKKAEWIGKNHLGKILMKVRQELR
jgi:predicted NAD-dependent protein-ADP-ribosyltransferase YbiA (DUF1768 family)